MDPNDKPQDVNESIGESQISDDQSGSLQTPVDIPSAPAEASQNVDESLTPASVGTDEGYTPPPADALDGALPTDEPPSSNLRTIIIAIIGVLILVAIGFIIFRFLKGGKPDEGGEVTLTYWGLWEPKEVMQTVFNDYERMHPHVKINYEMSSPTQYRERLQAAIQRGDGPDVFRFHNTWVPMMKNDIAPIPQSVMSTEEFSQTFYPIAQEDLIVDGSIYGLPMMIDGLLLFYNKDLLAEKGIAVPTTWEDFELVTRQLTVRDESGQLNQNGAAIGTADNTEHFSDILGLILYQNGGNFANLTSPESVQALSYYTLFAMEPNNIWSTSEDNSIIAFSQGKVAFIFAPSWQAFTIHEVNPNLSFGTAPVPQLRGGTPVAWANYWAEGVSATSKEKEEAYAFVRYLSEKDTVTQLFTEEQKTRLFGEPYARLDLADKLADHEYLGALIAQAPIMRSWYMASRTKDNGINDENSAYFKDAVNAVLQGQSPQAAMGTAASGVYQVLAKYGVEE